MALLFPRVARNFIKNGYYPTDCETLDCIAGALDIDPAAFGSGPSAPRTNATTPVVRVLDPCCGEGAALQSLSEQLQSLGVPVASYGVEIDAERAWHAKSLAGAGGVAAAGHAWTVAHADIHDMRIAERSIGLLFLNPPYGDLLGDRAGTGDTSTGRERHEKLFARRCLPLLQVGGVLVLVVPFTVLDREFATLIAWHCRGVRVYLAPEQQFRQCVVFGVKRRPMTPEASVVERLLAFGRGEDQETLPSAWPHAPYPIPSAPPVDSFHFTVTRLDARQLQAELDAGLAQGSLWPRFAEHLCPRATRPKRPLRAMTDWHLALALAAGQISGIVHSREGRRLLIKGRTHKRKDMQVLHETASDGTVSETRVLTDRFVTVIRAIDLTPGPGLGQVLTIA